MTALLAGSVLTFSCHDLGQYSGATLCASLRFDYFNNWFMNHRVFVVQLYTDFGALIYMEFLCPCVLLFGSLQVQALYFLLVQRSGFCLTDGLQILKSPEFVLKVSWCSLNLVVNGSSCLSYIHSGHTGHCSLY